MARLHPDAEKTRVVFASSAEEQVYSLCAEQLGDAWDVYYSTTLSASEDDERLQDNEMDFICYHPSWGLFVIEVKGGRISFDAATERWYSVNRHGERFEIKDPFQQALHFKSRLIRWLKNQNLKVPVSHAVILPSVNEEEFPVAAGVPRDIIIGRNRMRDVAAALKNIAELSHPEQYLRFADVRANIEKLLVGSTFTTRLYLREYIDSHDGRVKDVETIQETLITPIASARRLGIEGEAGTGKTMLASHLAKHFRDTGKSVLLLGSNGLLNLRILKDLGEGVDVLTYAEFATSFGVNLLIPPESYSGRKEDWVQFEAPELLKKAVTASTKRYSVVICDESQDVQPFWWDAIETVLDSADEESRFYLFFDSSQGVFGSGGDEQKFVAAEVLPVRPPYFPLVHNYRTTREIAAFSRSFRTGTEVLHSHCGRLGYVPEIVVYKDADDARVLLANLVKKLTREEAINREEITILSARNPAARESVLYKTDAIGGISLHRLTSTQKKSWHEAAAPRDSIGISTIAGFKGLETQVGILLNISEYNLPAENPIMSSMIYVACTRARHMLYVFIREGDPKLEVFRKALSSIRTSGSIVLEGTNHADFEFTGRVTYYNPNRVGWLAVDDPAFEQGSIMFFPHDVGQADLREIKVGSRIRFRPRVEGHMTIACDLVLSQGA